MADGSTLPVTPAHDVRGVLAIPAFRRLWIALSLSSLGDWLGLLATTALAASLAGGSYTKANLAIASVFLLRLTPAVVLGPIAGAVADRLDRRWTMVVVDILRFLLFASIPLVGTLWWLLIATLLIESATLFWIPAKEASVPNLVPRERLESANQLSLITTYGSAPVAALIFSAVSLLNGVVDNAVGDFKANPVDLALYFNALTFLVSALTISRLRGIPRVRTRSTETGFFRTIVDGWRFIGSTRLVRGLVFGMLGASAAGGAVVGLARTFVTDLHGGNPGYGLLFGTVFLGLALGMFVGPRLVPGFSRRRMFGLSIVAAGLCLALLAALPNLVIATGVTLVLGACAGVAWVTGYTLLGLEIADEVRGRTFAFVQTTVRVVLVLTLAVAPLSAAAVGRHHLLVGEVELVYGGAAATFLVAGLLAAVLGVVSFRAIDDRRGVPLFADVVAAYRDQPIGPATGRTSGFFIALEGGEGAGKSTQSKLLRSWLTELGHDVVATHEPGATPLGRQLRSVLLDTGRDPGMTPSPRAEALLFAADRAQHVDAVVRPALDRGAVVVTDRFVDSSVAYQGAGRELSDQDVRRVSRWATDDLQPDLTVVLDLPAALGLDRAGVHDRIEGESVEFHERVRQSFLTAAHADVRHYLVLDATAPPEEVAAAIRARVEPLLPLSGQQRAQREEVARTAEHDKVRRASEEAARLAAADEQARAAEEERRVAAEEARRTAEAEQRRMAEERARAQAAVRAEREAAEAQRRALEEAARLAAVEQARREAERLAAQQRDAAWREQQRQAAAGEREERERTERAPVRPHGRDDGASVPPTRPLSLADELFGGPADDETVHLPQVDPDHAERDR